MVLLFSLLLAGCRRKERSFDENVAEGLSKLGIVLPAATAAGVSVPKDAVMVFILPDKIEVDSTKGFVSTIEAKLPVNPSPYIVAPLDPARAATAGVSDKYKRHPGDPYIVPLGNVLSSYREKGAAGAVIVAPGQPPEQVVKEVRATIAASGYNELYRLARTADGKVVAEKVSF